LSRLWAWLSLLPAELAIEAALPVKYVEDPDDWTLFDFLMAVTIAAEVMVALTVYGFLWTHGQL
jgi:hypothetical protein